MDPLSQGTIGATLAQSASSKAKVKSATLMGCLGGLAPDLDVLIQSPTDPLLFLEFHRQFTHALIFIPVGALIVTAVMHRWAGKGLSFREGYLFCLLGYATHGLLDTCTTYGTQLLWPFSLERFAWNNVSIIDPIFTLPVLALIITGVIRHQPVLGRLALAWAVSYLLFGVFQRERAEAAGLELALSRGHEPVRLEAKPGFGSMLLWKIVYETHTEFHVDAVKVGIESRPYPGASATKLDVTKHYPWLDPDSQQAKDVERFRWFSNNYLAIDPGDPTRVIDVRYSVVPNEIDPLWGIQLDPNKSMNEHIDWQSMRRSDSAQTARWWRMLWD
jgi:inner membrane protein